MTLATLALSSFLSTVSSKAIMKKKVPFEGVLLLWAFYKRALWAFYTRKKKKNKEYFLPVSKAIMSYFGVFSSTS